MNKITQAMALATGIFAATHAMAEKAPIIDASGCHSIAAVSIPKIGEQIRIDAKHVFCPATQAQAIPTLNTAKDIAHAKVNTPETGVYLGYQYEGEDTEPSNFDVVAAAGSIEDVTVVDVNGDWSPAIKARMEKKYGNYSATFNDEAGSIIIQSGDTRINTPYVPSEPIPVINMAEIQPTQPVETQNTNQTTIAFPSTTSSDPVNSEFINPEAVTQAPTSHAENNIPWWKLAGTGGLIVLAGGLVYGFRKKIFETLESKNIEPEPDAKTAVAKKAVLNLVQNTTNTENPAEEFEYDNFIERLCTLTTQEEKIGYIGQHKNLILEENSFDFVKFIISEHELKDQLGLFCVLFEIENDPKNAHRHETGYSPTFRKNLTQEQKDELSTLITPIVSEPTSFLSQNFWFKKFLKYIGNITESENLKGDKSTLDLNISHEKVSESPIKKIKAWFLSQGRNQRTDFSIPFQILKNIEQGETQQIEEIYALFAEKGIFQEFSDAFTAQANNKNGFSPSKTPAQWKEESPNLFSKSIPAPITADVVQMKSYVLASTKVSNWLRGNKIGLSRLYGIISSIDNETDLYEAYDIIDNNTNFDFEDLLTTPKRIKTGQEEINQARTKMLSAIGQIEKALTPEQWLASNGKKSTTNDVLAEA